LRQYDIRPSPRFLQQTARGSFEIGQTNDFLLHDRSPNKDRIQSF
jgi:hypothetical protein